MKKCASKNCFATGDIVVVEGLIGHLRRLKENLSFLSMIFLPISIVNGGKLIDLGCLLVYFPELIPAISRALVYLIYVAKNVSFWDECWWRAMDRAKQES